MFITWPLLPGDDLSPLPNKLTGYDFISCEGPSLKLSGHLDLGYQPIFKGEGMAYRRDHNMWFAGVIVSAVTITSASLPYLRCADWHGSWPATYIYISDTKTSAATSLSDQCALLLISGYEGHDGKRRKVSEAQKRSGFTATWTKETSKRRSYFRLD